MADCWHWISSPNASSWALVYVGIAGVFTALLTLGAIWHQAVKSAEAAKAARDAAEAAKISAEAFITESRPWLLVDKNMALEGAHAFWQFQIRIHNFGKTPAKIVALQMDMSIGTSKDTPPHPEMFERDSPFDSPFVVPQGEHITQDFNLERAKEIQEVAKGNKHLWLCGVVKYQDTFDSATPTVHETLFCLRCEPFVADRPVWRRGGLDKYNKAT